MKENITPWAKHLIWARGPLVGAVKGFFGLRDSLHLLGLNRQDDPKYGLT